MAIVMGVDAGFTHMGMVAVENGKVIDYQTVRTEKTAKKRGIRVADDDAERCMKLAEGLFKFIDKHKPAGAFVELPTGGAQGARANRTMGMATAVVVCVLHLAEVPAEWITPMAVKKAATGRKNASKEEVQKAVINSFEWEGDIANAYQWKKEHVCDAAGAVIAAQNGMLAKLIREVAQ